MGTRVAVGVGVCVVVGSGVGEDVEVGVMVAVGSGVDVFAGVAVGSGVGVEVGSGVAVLVGVAVRVGTRVCVAVGSGVAVAVDVGSGVRVLVAVNVGGANADVSGANADVGVTVAACWASTQPVATSKTTAGTQANTFSRKKISPMRVKPFGYHTQLNNALGTKKAKLSRPLVRCQTGRGYSITEPKARKGEMRCYFLSFGKVLGAGYFERGRNVENITGMASRIRTLLFLNMSGC